MIVKKIKIKNFRSINDLVFDCEMLAILCGSNSVGKSNIFRAIEFAFLGNIDANSVLENISYTKKDSSAQIQVDMIFDQCPKKIRELAEASTGAQIKYVFRATKKGVITRKLNNVELDDEKFKKLTDEFSIVYIPTIRDLNGDGIVPFQQLFKKSIQLGASGKNLRDNINNIKSLLASKAASILSNQRDVARNILNLKSFDINTDSVIIDQSYNAIKLAVKTQANRKIPLNDLGTGHQSIAIISFYRQLGAESPGHVLYLFEEPDTHLHPPTVRAVGEELIKTSLKSQVFVTTHSPILIAHVGLDKAFHLKHSEQLGTTIDKSNFQAEEQAATSHLLMQFGLRLTEALFTKSVILVEGPSDVAVIGRLLERRLKRNVDQLDLVIIPAGGKNTMPALASALSKLKVNWIAILDYDAAFNTDYIPITSENGFSATMDDVSYIQKIDELISIVDVKNKRGKNVHKQLNFLKSELQSGRPNYEAFEGSALKELLISGRSASSKMQDNIKRAIIKNQKTVCKKLLKDNQIFLMQPDIENIITSKDSSLPVIERILRQHGVILPGTPTPCERKLLARKLHEVGQRSEVIVQIVDAVDDVSGFSRTDLNVHLTEIVALI